MIEKKTLYPNGMIVMQGIGPQNSDAFEEGHYQAMYFTMSATADDNNDGGRDDEVDDNNHDGSTADHRSCQTEQSF